MNDSTKELNFSNMVSEDNITDAQDVFKGLVALLDSMAMSDDSGEHRYSKQAFEMLLTIAQSGVDKMEDMIPKIRYMQNTIRGK